MNYFIAKIYSKMLYLTFSYGITNWKYRQTYRLKLGVICVNYFENIS